VVRHDHDRLARLILKLVLKNRKEPQSRFSLFQDLNHRDRR